MKCSLRRLFAAGMFLIATGAMPVVVEAQQSRSLDQQLLDELNADPLDEFDRELFGPDPRQGRGGDAPSEADGEPGDRELGDRLRRELGAAADPEDDDPLLSIARRMREVEGRIVKEDSGNDTQDLQEKIVADLDELIQQARKRCRQGRPGDGLSQASRRSGGQPPPKQGSPQGNAQSTPARTSNASPGQGTARRPDMQEMRDVVKQLWGMLPQHGRERVIQPRTEEFLPKYELLIEEYFRRLSEEKRETDVNGNH